MRINKSAANMAKSEIIKDLPLACSDEKAAVEPMYFCNKCRKYFGPPRRPHSIGQKSAKPSRKKKP